MHAQHVSKIDRNRKSIFGVLILLFSILSIGSITYESDLNQQTTPSETATETVTQSLTPSLSPTSSGTQTPLISSTPTSSGTITPSQSITLLPTISPSLAPTQSPEISPTEYSPLVTGSPIASLEVTPVPAVQTLVIIPFPTFTLLFPVKSATPVLLSAERHPQAGELVKSTSSGLRRRVYRLWPLGILIVIWSILGVWFVVAQRQME